MVMLSSAHPSLRCGQVCLGVVAGSMCVGGGVSKPARSGFNLRFLPLTRVSFSVPEGRHLRP